MVNVLMDYAKVFSPGEVVYNKGQKAENMYIVLEGIASVCRENVLISNVQAKNIEGAIDFFGEEALLDNGVYGAWVMAGEGEGLRVAEIPKDIVTKLLNKKQKYRKIMIKALAARLNFYNQMVIALEESILEKGGHCQENSIDKMVLEESEVGAVSRDKNMSIRLIQRIVYKTIERSDIIEILQRKSEQLDVAAISLNIEDEDPLFSIKA